jgi:hypothetical protein
MNKQELTQKIIDLIASTHNEYDCLETSEPKRRVLLQAVNDIQFICLREKQTEEPLKLTKNAWRVLTLLEEDADPLYAGFEDMGHSTAFIKDCFHASPECTEGVINGAIQELLEAGLIERVGLCTDRFRATSKREGVQA